MSAGELDLDSFRRRVLRLQIDAQDWARMHRDLPWAAMLPRDVSRLLESIDWLDRLERQHEAEEAARGEK
jgi:hypothetical protein